MFVICRRRRRRRSASLSLSLSLSLFLIWQMLISRAKRKEDMKGLTNCDWQACVVRPLARGNEYVNGIKRGGEAEGDNLIN